MHYRFQGVKTEEDSNGQLLGSDILDEELDLEFMEDDQSTSNGTFSNEVCCHTKLINNRLRLPKFSQVLESVNLLRRYFPNTFTDEFIDQMYEDSHLCYGQDPDRNQAEQMSYSRAEPTKLQEHVGSLADHAKQVARAVFYHKQKDYRLFNQQMLEAGIPQISQKHYSILVEQLILEAYDYVCSKASREFNLKVLTLDRAQTSLMVELFCSCTVSFSKDISSIILSLIKGLEKAQNRTVLCAEDARKVYSALTRSIRSNMGASRVDIKRGGTKGLPVGKQSIGRPLMDIRTKKAKLEGMDYLRDTRRKKVVHELEAHWNGNLEKILIQLYKERYHFSYIRDYFQSNYPTHKELFTVLSVRSRLFKILRVGIRKVYYFLANSGAELPQLLNLDDERIKTIVYSQETLHLRILVLCVYELREFHFETVRQTIEACNQYFLKSQAKGEGKLPRGKVTDIIFNEGGGKESRTETLLKSRARSKKKGSCG